MRATGAGELSRTFFMNMDVQAPDNLTGSPAPLTPEAWPRRRVPLIAIILVMVAAWSLVMIFRWELRAQWWAMQVTRVESQPERDFYITRLASIGDKSLRVLPALLNDSRPEIREAGVQILRYCEDERAGEYLIGQLRDPEPEVAMLAAGNLAWRPGASRYVSRLCESLRSRKDDPAAWGIIVALGRIDGPEAEQALIEACEASRPPEIRAQAIDSLGMLGCKQAVPLVLEAMTDHRPLAVLPQSQLSARRAIGALGAQLAARGANPDQARASIATEPTVAGVAAHWYRLLTGMAVDPATSQPDDEQRQIIEQLKSKWAAEQAAISSRTAP